MPARRNPSLEDWRQFYEPDLAAIVAERYRSDFTRFGYEPTIDAKILRAAKKAPGIKSLGERIDLYTGHGAASMKPMMKLNLRRLTAVKVGEFKGCPPA